MIEANAVIVNSRGMHARPSAKLAKLAGRFAADIFVYKGKRKADAKSIASLLTLAAAAGTTLRIVAAGADEKEAVAAVLRLVAAGFQDEEAENHPRAVVPEAPAGAPRKKAAAYTVSGIGVGAAVVVGRAHIHNAAAGEVSQYKLEKAQVGREVRRYNKAVESVRGDFAELRRQAEALPGAAEIVPFIDLYDMLLGDADFAKKPQELIRRRQINAEWALMERVNVVADSFRRINDSYLRERGRDIGHVMTRLLAAMGAGTRRRKLAAAGEKRILLSNDLDPAEVVRARHAGYIGFITEGGGGASHTAILARSMQIPALVGARGVLECAAHGAPLLLNAAAGVVVVNPDAHALALHKPKRGGKRGGKKPAAKKTKRPRAGSGCGATTMDGEKVFLHSNIEMPDEARLGQAAGADGVGLFRTEFLFMNRADLPGEDEQFEIYRDVLRQTAPLPVVIRTLDLGGDKMPQAEAAAGGRAANPANPALGVRAIRYCLAAPEMFLAQLRALVRANAEAGAAAGAGRGNLRILLPMLSHPSELAQALALLDAAREQVRTASGAGAGGGADLAKPPVGAMIEVPASVFVMAALAKNLDFFSIGTNDLIQYALAIDRNEEMLARLYDPLHPAVLRLLSLAVENAARANLPVMLCGEIAGEPNLTRLLLALGLRRLSMAADAMEAVREKIKTTNTAALQTSARHILRAQDPEAARAILEEMNAD